MRVLAISMILLSTIVTIGCGAGGGGSQEPNAAITKITDWQAREAACQDTKEHDHGSLDESDLSEVLDLVTGLIYGNGITYETDPDGYWKTSCETAKDKRGDCEDQAFYWYARIREQQWFADVHLSLVWINFSSEGRRAGHMLLRIQTLDQPIWISNNVVLTSLDMYDGKDMTIEYEFDLWSYWW